MLYQSGTRALDRGEIEIAIDDLERAAHLVPQASEIQNHLGIAYARASRFGAAIAAYERALELDCANGAALENLQAARAHEASRSAPKRQDGSDSGGVTQ